MCGIIGTYSPKEAKDVLANRLTKGIELLKHRGPDDHGVEMISLKTGYLALGHTRLSIIDLSSAGHQPMSSNDGRFTVVFNGEIYNYRELRNTLTDLGFSFQSDSDTEVLLASWAAWGKDCLKKFVGMFAFAIFDRRAGTLTCVRDAFGIKPMFYSIQKGEFLFSSEVNALNELVIRRQKPNYQMIYDYLVFGGYDNQINTFFQDIYHLLPGHILTIDLSGSIDNVSQERWWMPSIHERNDLTIEEAANKLRHLFLNSVRLHLRSDVPVGAALSGGLDSSAVVCAMRYLEPEMPIHTFTYVADSGQLNEEKWADVVNSKTHAISHKVFADHKEFGREIDDMIETQGEPFVGTSIYAQYQVFRSARQNGIVVTLDGQGADELLAGYVGFPQERFKSFVESGKIIKGIQFIWEWSKWPGRSKKECFKAITRPFLPGWVYTYLNRNTLTKTVPSWICKDAMTELQIEFYNLVKDPKFQDDPGRGRSVMKTLRAALTGNGLNSLLRHADRNAMKWSIESRVPFLTIELAEFLLSLPESYLISGTGETKSLFRRAMRGIVPDEILDRKDKIGFETPELELLRLQEKQVINWLEGAKLLPFIDYDKLKAEVEDVLGGKKAYNSRVWRIINVSKWMNQFV